MLECVVPTSKWCKSIPVLSNTHHETKRATFIVSCTASGKVFFCSTETHEISSGSILRTVWQPTGSNKQDVFSSIWIPFLVHKIRWFAIHVFWLSCDSMFVYFSRVHLITQSRVALRSSNRIDSFTSVKVYNFILCTEWDPATRCTCRREWDALTALNTCIAFRVKCDVNDHYF